jgi:hypothetical protein
MHPAFSLCFAVLIAFGLPQFASAQSPLIEDLLSVERDLNSLCRGGSGNQETAMKICDLRDRVDQILSTLGYCYGTQGQAGNQMQWHKCTKGSNGL